jgi:hypothetical protein
MPHTILASVCDTKLHLMAGSDSAPLPFIKYLPWFPVSVKKVISNFFNVFIYLFIYLFISLLMENKLKAKFYIKYLNLNSAFIKVAKR